MKAKMGAPQVTIETITITRPLKVIAFTCCVLTVFLMLGATATADWMMAEGWREGLFVQCVSLGAHRPLPFDMPEEVGCTKARSASYLRGCAALCIIGIITDFFGTMLTCLGLKSTDPNKKYKYYRVSIYALIFAGIAFLLAAIIYPIQFAKDLKDEKPKNGLVIEPELHLKGKLDFDNDGIIDLEDDDDDNDGIPDAEDTDDDNDGILDDADTDDDNDGIPDTEENPEDFDGDGIPDNQDNDDDNDGIPDAEDEDDDNDGIDDDLDTDDDNDGIPDNVELDTDGDGIIDLVDDDDDGDNIPDDKDQDDDNDGIPDNKEDKDGDGIPDNEDTDDDGDGIPDSKDGDDGKPDQIGGIAGTPRTYSFGFGYGATWGSIILIFASVVLLICDRESEEIFYKERRMEDEEEEEESGEA